MINKLDIPLETLTREKVLEENKRVHKLFSPFFKAKTRYNLKTLQLLSKLRLVKRLRIPFYE